MRLEFLEIECNQGYIRFLGLITIRESQKAMNEGRLPKSLDIAGENMPDLCRVDLCKRPSEADEEEEEEVEKKEEE